MPWGNSRRLGSFWPGLYPSLLHRVQLHRHSAPSYASAADRLHLRHLDERVLWGRSLFAYGTSAGPHLYRNHLHESGRIPMCRGCHLRDSTAPASGNLQLRHLEQRILWSRLLYAYAASARPLLRRIHLRESIRIPVCRRFNLHSTSTAVNLCP